METEIVTTRNGRRVDITEKLKAYGSYPDCLSFFDDTAEFSMQPNGRDCYTSGEEEIDIMLLVKIKEVFKDKRSLVDKFNHTEKAKQLFIYFLSSRGASYQSPPDVKGVKLEKQYESKEIVTEIGKHIKLSGIEKVRLREIVSRDRGLFFMLDKKDPCYISSSDFVKFKEPCCLIY